MIISDSFVKMKIHGLLFLAPFIQFAAACGGDNCANHVTGRWGGIGVPLASRVSMCNSFLRTTIQLPEVTVTTTIHRYTKSLPDGAPSPSTQMSTRTIPVNWVLNNTIIVPTSVPTFAANHCPRSGQFSSACKCWASVMPQNTTMPALTSTATATVWHDVACGPAATAVVPGNSSYFPCSRQWGTCSCLRSGEDDVCVRVGPFLGGGGNMTGPCADFDECDADENCPSQHICVYDGSCKCGKRRCYKAAPRGCEYQDLPIDDWGRKLPM